MHGAAEIYTPLHAVFRQAAHNTRYSIYCLRRQLLCFSSGQESPSLLRRFGALVYHRIQRRGATDESRVVAILNPAAGRGRAEQLWSRVATRLEWHGIHASALRTAGPGDATRLTREALAAGSRTIMAVGGDGTIHEVVNGFLDDGAIRQDARLAVLPAGTGVDFVRNLGLRRGVVPAVERVLRGRETRIDLGRAGEYAFVNFAETGLGASVVAREREFGGGWPGRASFFLAAVQAAMDEDNIGVRIVVDGGAVYDGPAVSVVVANGRYFGGGMKIAPSASMDDGLFDIFVLGDFNRIELVSQIWKIYPGVHVGHRKVLWRRGRRIEIDVDRQTRLDLDGELRGPGPYQLDIHPGALRVVV